MKKNLFLFAILVFSIGVSAGNPWRKKSAREDIRESHAFAFGYCSFQPERLNTYFAPYHQSKPFADTYYTLGTEEFETEHPLDAAFSVHWMLPMESFAGYNDSIRMKLGGWQMMTSIFGFDVLKSEVVDLTIGPQFTWGNYRLKYTAAGSSDKKYKNPVVAPGGRIDFKFNLGKFVIGARATYCYDITDPKWKRKSPGLDPLPGYNNRGLYYVAYIGYIKE